MHDFSRELRCRNAVILPVMLLNYFKEYGRLHKLIVDFVFSCCINEL